VKIGPVDPEITAVQEIVKKKEINVSKTYSPQASLPSGLKSYKRVFFVIDGKDTLLARF